MKAVFVIDVDDCVNVEACNSTVYVEFPFTADGWAKKYSNVSIKPMPKKRDNNEEWLNEYHRDDYADGWNACLDAITGEENESRMD